VAFLVFLTAPTITGIVPSYFDSTNLHSCLGRNIGAPHLHPSFEKLDVIAKKQSDNEFATLMQKAKDELFDNFNRRKLQFPTFFTTFVSGLVD